MTEIEAIENLKMILEEATEDEHSVCYVTSCDKEHLEMAIKSLEKQIKIKEIIGLLKNEMYDDEIAELFSKIKELVD